jgi:hypothetical protein
MASIWLLMWISCVHVDDARECNSGPMYGAKVYQTEAECDAQVSVLMPHENEVPRLQSAAPAPVAKVIFHITTVI